MTSSAFCLRSGRPAMVVHSSTTSSGVSHSVIAAAQDTPAKILFSRVQGPAPLEARSIGFYSRGCFSGGYPDSHAVAVTHAGRHANPVRIAPRTRLLRRTQQADIASLADLDRA